MANVDANQISDMARLINLMNTGVAFEEEPVMESENSLTQKVNSSHNVDPGIAEMKRILEIFQSPSNEINPANSLKQRAVVDRTLREAMVTSKTEDGVRIGNWDIVINESDRGLKTFDVISTKSGEKIAFDLTIYEAAYGIAKAMNEGLGINSRKVRDILQAEGEYSHYRNDAAIYKRKLAIAESSTTSQKTAIMEDRFDESLRRAKFSREKLIKLVNSN